jgi:hypothetical protein
VLIVGGERDLGDESVVGCRRCRFRIVLAKVVSDHIVDKAVSIVVDSVRRDLPGVAPEDGLQGAPPVLEAVPDQCEYDALPRVAGGEDLDAVGIGVQRAPFV